MTNILYSERGALSGYSIDSAELCIMPNIYCPIMALLIRSQYCIIWGLFIQGAPKLTADAAGLPVSSVTETSVPLVIVMGLIITVAAFWKMRRDLKKGMWRDGLFEGGSGGGDSSYNKFDDKIVLSYRTKQALAILVPTSVPC